MLSDFYKKNKTDTIWWIDNLESFGEHLFSFDKKHIYNLFQDYPHMFFVLECWHFVK